MTFRDIKAWSVFIVCMISPVTVECKSILLEKYATIKN